MSVMAHSRSLPGWLFRMLNALATQEHLEVGRSNKTAKLAIALGFVEKVSHDRRHLVLKIAPHGRTALERHFRGTDPFIRVTD